jgi:hypothetical protein
MELDLAVSGSGNNRRWHKIGHYLHRRFPCSTREIATSMNCAEFTAPGETEVDLIIQE